MNDLKVCAVCDQSLKDGDNYCRHCGAPRNEKDYDPFSNIMECLYGPPPPERIHQCKKCGKKWSNYSFVDRDKYCPACGGEAPIIEIKGDDWS